MRLQTRALAALATLDRCPSLPADVLACLLGLRSRAAAYQLLARLAHAGLAEARPVELGHVLGGRRIGLWSLTEQGQQRLGDHPHRCGVPGGAVTAYGLRSGPRARPRPTELPLLVSSYRLLAAL